MGFPGKRAADGKGAAGGKGAHRQTNQPQSSYYDYIPTKIPWLNISGKLPIGMRIRPLNLKIMLESNPLKSIMLVGRLAVYLPFQ